MKTVRETGLTGSTGFLPLPARNPMRHAVGCRAAPTREPLPAAITRQRAPARAAGEHLITQEEDNGASGQGPR